VAVRLYKQGHVSQRVPVTKSITIKMFDIAFASVIFQHEVEIRMGLRAVLSVRRALVAVRRAEVFSHTR
jgi:hypothetical protein